MRDCEPVKRSTGTLGALASAVGRLTRRPSPHHLTYAPSGQMSTFMKAFGSSQRHVTWNDVCHSVAFTRFTVVLTPRVESRYVFNAASVGPGSSRDAKTLASRLARFAAPMATPTPRPVMADDFPAWVRRRSVQGQRSHVVPSVWPACVCPSSGSPAYVCPFVGPASTAPSRRLSRLSLVDDIIGDVQR